MTKNPEAGVRQKGEVSWFNEQKGFGFITGEDGQDVFVHYTEIIRDGFQTLEPGERVTFELADHDAAPRAVEVRPEVEGVGPTFL